MTWLFFCSPDFAGLSLDCMDRYMIVDPWLKEDWMRIVTWFNQDWSRIEAGLKDCKCTGEVPELPKSLPPPVSVHLCTWLEQDWSRIVKRNDSIELQSTWIGLGLESGRKDCRSYPQSASIEAVLDPPVHLVHPCAPCAPRLDWCRIVTRL